MKTLLLLLLLAFSGALRAQSGELWLSVGASILANRNIGSPFPGKTKRRFWLVGHQFIQTSRAPHELYLRDGFGDIIILKIRAPKPPEPLTAAPKRDGL